MPVRDPLPLTLPPEVGEQAGPDNGAHAAAEEPDEEEPADLGPTEEDAVPARPTIPRRRRR